MQKETIKDYSGLFFETVCRVLLSLILCVLLAGMAFGMLQALADLGHYASALFTGEALHSALKEVMIDVLMVLAVLELFRTVKSYFIEGRVKVTYIIDTVLVVVITEIMGFWYREVEPERIAMALALVVTLMFVRIMAIRFSPKRREMLDGL